LAGFIPQHNSVNGPRGLRRGDSAVGIFHKVEYNLCYFNAYGRCGGLGLIVYT
jgi:hypothetical protein